MFSGKGVSQLRTYLTELFDRITEMNHTDDTEYEEDDFDGEGYQEDETPEPEGFGEGRQMIGYPRQHILYNPNVTTTRGPHPDQAHQPTAHPEHGPAHEFAFQRDRPVRASTIPTSTPRREPEGSPTANLLGATSRLNAQIQASTPTAGPRLPRVRIRHGHTAADVLPIIESSSQSLDEASRNDPSNADHGSNFFRAHQDRPSTNGISPRGNRALTPDLNYAEIGHGRGAQTGSTSRAQHLTTNERTPRPYFNSRLSPAPEPPGSASSRTDSESEDEPEQTTPAIPYADNKWTMIREPVLTPPATTEPQDSVQSTLGSESRGRPEQTQASQTSQPRARSVKRSLRNTFSAAEHYASSLLFGRSSGDVHPEAGGSGSGSGGSNSQGSRQR